MEITVDVPDGTSGIWAVKTFEVSELDAQMANIRERVGRFILPGTYKKLTRGDTVVMSNTPAEISDHMYFINNAKKCENVLINGLGLGVALKAILESDVVKKIDIVELSEDVIKLVSPTFQIDPRVNIIHSDAFEYKPKKNFKYGAVWHDIWDNICGDNLPGMKKLHRKYGKASEWQGSWCRSICQQLKAKALGL